MKSSHSIISFLKEKPELQKLKKYDEINKLIALLPIQMRKYIAFGYQRGEKLYFALKNPTVIPEYNNYHAQTILFTLHSTQEFFPQIGSTQTVCFYYPKPLEKNKEGRYFTAPKHYALYSQKIETIYIQSFEEKSKGEFINHSTHPKIFKLFEDIRKAIQEKCHS